MKIKDLKIAHKLNGGFGIILILLVIVGAVGIFGFGSYREIARDNVLMGRIQANLLMCRLMVKEFVKTSSEASVEEFNTRMTQLKEFVQEAQDDINNSARAEKVDLIDQDITKYQDGFKQVTDYAAKRNQIVADLAGKGLKMRENLTEIMKTAYRDGDPSAAYYAGRAQEHVVLGRLYVYKFLDQNFQEDYNRAIKEFIDETDHLLATMDQNLQNSNRRRMLAEVVEIKENYLKNLDELKNTIFARNEVIKGTLDKIGPEVADAAEWIKLDIKEEQDTLGPMVTTILIVASILGVILSFIVSITITKQIKQPVDEILDVALAMSEGNVNKKITIKQKDEIGQMADAFKEMQGVVQNILGETDRLIGATKDGKLDARGNAADYKGSWNDLIEGVNDLINAFVGPINVTAEYVDRISKGDIPPRITDEYKGDFNEIKNNLNQCIDIMSSLLVETNTLVEGAKNGKLDLRADKNKFTGDWQTLVGGVNELVDAFVGPINVTAEYVDRISKGDIPPKIVDEYKGDFNEIKNNLNQCINIMTALLDETGMLIDATKNGKLDVRANKDTFTGDWQTLVGGVNELVDAFVGPINVTAEYVDRISKGDIPPKITDEYKGDFNEIKNNLNQCINIMTSLLDETGMLIDATKNGRLDVRANKETFTGDWQTLVGGVNELVDAFVGPINVTAEYVDRISKGDIPPKITDEYKGDFNEIKNNLNQCIDVLNGLINEMNHMSTQHDLGDIDVIIPVDNFTGAYNTMAQGINDMVNGHISVKKKAMACIAEFGEGNFDAEIEQFPGKKKFINDTIEAVRVNLKKIASEVNELIDATKEGKLDVRGNRNNFTGDWAELVSGMNDLIDAFVAPINVTAEYVDRISKGDIPPKITDEYKGDFNEIKNNLNQCIDVLNGLINDMNHMSTQHDLGDIDVIIPVDNFSGAYNTMAQGINDMVNGHISVKKKAMVCIAEFGEGNFDAEIEQFPGKKKFINDTIEAVRVNLKNISTEVKDLINASKNGKLDVRGDRNKFTGDWAELVSGMNDLIDAFVGPINVTAEYVDRISKGDIPPKITDEYKGDFNEIKNNLNVCIDAISSMVADANMLAKAGSEGRLRTRANADKHGGDFRNIIAGVNNTLDSVVGVIDNLPIPAMGIDKDFNIIYMNDTGAGLSGKTGSEVEGMKCFDHFKTSDCKTQNCAAHRAMQTKSISSSETSAQPVPGVELEISYSGIPIKDDKGNAIGAFEVVMDQTEIKTAMNRNNKIAEYQAIETNKLVEALEMLAEGDFSAHVDLNDPDDDTREAFDILSRILTAIRKFTGAVFQLQDDVKQLSGAAVDGNLAHRADTVRHNGDFRTLVEGLNATLDFIIEPVNEANEILSFLAQGDLTVKVSGDYKGDHKKLKESMNHLSDSLANVISRVRASVESVSSASIETSSTAEAMAAASQEQSSQADEVASAVEEMSRTITENAMAAGRTAEVAEKNGSIAKDGGDVVEQTINKMKDIASVVHQSAENIEKLGESSKKIGEIISVIDDIADQTNLLALNAAIEAARAGEQGRGFAVVADEVRKLAERTTEATKQIASMIKGIQAETEVAVKVMTHGNEEVKSGIELADRAGNALEQVVGSSQEVLDMINQIAAASEEQSSTSEQISQNVMAISKVTADSARRVEEIAGASEGIAKLSEELAGLMAAFKIADSAYSLGSGSSGMVNQKLEARENKMLTGYEE